MSLLEFFDKVANEKTTTFNDSGVSPFINRFMMAQAGVDYYFNFLWFGFEVKTHMVKGSMKPYICSRYYDEPCEKCNQDSNFPDEKNEGKFLKDKPRRCLYSPIFCHNNNGRTYLKNDQVKHASPECILETACGEENTQTGYVKDRNIIPYKNAQAQDVLLDEVFVIRRDMKKDKNGKEKSITTPGQMISGKAKCKYIIEMHEAKDGGPEEKRVEMELTANQLGSQVPQEVKDKWAKMTLGEKIGIVLSIMDNCKKDIWEAKGVVFPKLPEKKEKKEETDIEKAAE